ncbi:hypothetical protein RhiirC2_41293 [Rhizophagus irregularis]|uniref:Uncharacterized protein n=1 Tax=Rhizophagus irregularis TaxID=588596 RepID=A0A2N1MXA3_9GLOM|nr:hypothetical protein RhiirC2_41293 [Rhizophagus irregularis]
MISIYTNYRILDFYKDLYKEKLDDGEVIFKREFHLHLFNIYLLLFRLISEILVSGLRCSQAC